MQSKLIKRARTVKSPQNDKPYMQTLLNAIYSANLLILKNQGVTDEYIHSISKRQVEEFAWQLGITPEPFSVISLASNDTLNHILHEVNPRRAPIDFFLSKSIINSKYRMNTTNSPRYENSSIGYSLRRQMYDFIYAKTQNMEPQGKVEREPDDMLAKMRRKYPDDPLFKEMELRLDGQTGYIDSDGNSVEFYTPKLPKNISITQVARDLGITTRSVYDTLYWPDEVLFHDFSHYYSKENHLGQVGEMLRDNDGQQFQINFLRDILWSGAETLLNLGIWRSPAKSVAFTFEKEFIKLIPSSNVLMKQRKKEASLKRLQDADHKRMVEIDNIAADIEDATKDFRGFIHEENVTKNGWTSMKVLNPNISHFHKYNFVVSDFVRFVVGKYNLQPSVDDIDSLRQVRKYVLQEIDESENVNE